MASTLRNNAQRVMELARERGRTIATAESCTAGSLAHLLAQCDGAGAILHGGFVVYTAANKMAALGVPKELIDQHTAVSGEVAEAMVAGTLRQCPADFAVSITGVAGPDPDDDGNPVGLVYVAAGGRGTRVRHARHEFGNRSKTAICAAAMHAALLLLAQLLIEAQTAPRRAPASNTLRTSAAALRPVCK